MRAPFHPAPIAIVAFAALLACPPTTSGQSAVGRGDDGRLIYAEDERGNRVPDFSSCGYAGADREIPDVPTRVSLAPGDGDDGPRIQAAIDQVAAMPADENGFCGAVQLAPGRFEVAGQLRITTSGIVLRGSGADQEGTTIVATGQDRRALVRVFGRPERIGRNDNVPIVDEYVPVGAAKFRVAETNEFQAGDIVTVTRPSTSAWVQALGADAFGVGWREGSRNVRWNRRIMAVDGGEIQLDAPITTAIDQEFGGGTVAHRDANGPIERVGIEDVRLVSAHDRSHPHDEEHAWFGVTMDCVRDAWVRRVRFRGFAGGAVAAWESTSRITVEDCISTAPVSEVGGYRRHTFFTQGQQTLFLRCWSDRGRHDFSVGHCAAGPNSFVDCVASRALGESGPLESWASGVLYDNVRIDGAALVLDNRWTQPPGCGWSAANCVLWNCQAATMRVFRPPTANNWALGAWAMFAGDGVFEARSDFVKPLSLYQAQLRERLGEDAARRVEPLLLNPESSTSPTVEEAAGFVARSDAPARQLVDVIKDRMRASGHALRAEPFNEGEPASRAAEPRSRRIAQKQMSVQNGWLAVDGAVAMGRTIHPKWWAGNTRPDEAPAFGPAITRFVPGRVGRGFTDDLVHMVNDKSFANVAAYEHHYGLWYDLRRADHLNVRQADGAVAPPFYEQPFARTGRGRAWDGLSKYDLSKFNPWYWGRLDQFAALGDERGIALIHQHYFQHNILEAGAHWVDCPWRPVNNVNDTGFPEPPPFIGDKRIFLAHQFYDVTHPVRRALHRGYIRHCLDALAERSNVIHMTSAEFTGPLEFMQFWLDVVGEWQQEHGRDVLVGLSATKDVQDAILADPVRAKLVDVIDIRYWCYTADGSLYAPRGGQNMAPRQFLRQTRQKPGGFAEIVRAVREYRVRYPDKAVTYYADKNCPSRYDGWAVLIGGGSLADVNSYPPKLATAIAAMQPADGVVEGADSWCLASDDGDYLVACRDAATVRLHLQPGADYQAIWLDSDTGREQTRENVPRNDAVQLSRKANALWLVRETEQ